MTPGGVEYRKACAGAWGWGAWTNGAFLFKRHVLEAEVREGGREGGSVQ